MPKNLLNAAALILGLAASCLYAAEPAPLRMVIASPCPYWGIDKQIAGELRAEGVELFAYPECPKLKDTLLEGYVGERLLDYNILIFGDPHYRFGRPDPVTGAVPNEIVHLAGQLKKFLAGGGGVWFCGLGEQNWGKTAGTLNYILRELDLDAEVTGEVVMDTAVQQQGSRFGEQAWVEVVGDPLTQGVDNVLHPVGVVAGEGSMGVVPITRLGPDWRVLLRGSETAASYPIDLTPPPPGDKLATTPGTVTSRPVLCAVRDTPAGGRVVLWPTYTNYTVTAGSRGMLFDGERDGRKSHGRRLIKRLLRWLAEPARGSKTVGLFDPAQYVAKIEQPDPDRILQRWCVPGRKDYANQYRGLVGAHSSLSDGQNTPEEMIAAAQAAGYDFIAFTEDLAAMDELKWQQLLAVCNKVNQANPKFRAFQGLDFLDEAGNRGVVFGQRYWVTEKLRSTRDPTRVEYWYSFTYKADSNPKSWPPRIIIRSKTNNKRPWNQGMWSLFAPYCYEGGELVDDSFDEYRQLVGRHNFVWNAGIAAVHTVRSVEDVAAAARPGRYQFYVRADQLAATRDPENPKGVYDSIWTNCGPWKPDPETDRTRDYYPHYFPCYPSSGPEILDFRTKFLGEGFGADMAIPGNNRSMLHIYVRAPAGLDEVRIYDRERLVRRYKPGGTVFEHFMTIPNNEQHSYTTTVTDAAGGRAVSWPAWTHIQELAYLRCGDNWNYNTLRKLRHGQDYEPKYSLLEVQSGWDAKKAKAEAERPRYWCYQSRVTHVGPGAASVNYIFPDHQNLLVDDEPWGAAHYAKALAVDLSSVGPYGAVAANVIRYDYREKKPEPYNYADFAGPYRAVASPWPCDQVYYYPFSRWNGANVVRCMGRIRFARKVSTADGSPIRLGLGYGDKGNPDILEVRTADGTVTRHNVGDGSNVAVDLPVGGYACWYDDKGDGIGGVIGLSPGVVLHYSRDWQGLRMQIPSPAEPMSEVTWDVVFVSGTPATSNSNEQMLDVWQGMGFAGKPTLYDVQPRVGRVIDQRFFLTLAAANGGFRGRIVKTTGKLLPLHLPVWIEGLNPRWDAGIWYRGETELEVISNHRDPWGMRMAWILTGRYERRVDEVRYIPVLEKVPPAWVSRVQPKVRTPYTGTGYCQIETDRQDPDIFVGNFLVCDRPEVFIGMRGASKGACTFEVNNPTERTHTVTVRPAEGFDLTGRWERTLELGAGAHQVVTVAGE